MGAHEELHTVVESLDDDDAQRLLDVALAFRFRDKASVRRWQAETVPTTHLGSHRARSRMPKSVGAGAGGPPDLSSRADEYLAEGFGTAQ